MNLADAFRVNARARPRHPAIVHGERTILHGELDDLVRRTARFFSGLGVTHGQVVGVALGDTPEHLVSIYALAALGAIVLPMDWRWTVAEQEQVSRRFEAKLVLLEPGQTWNEAIPAIRCDDGWQAGVARASPIERLVDEDELPFLLSLSSGTTGLAKGPLITQGQFLRRFWPHWINLGLNAQSRYMSATPLYFGGGRTYALSQLYCGGTVILFPPPYQPEELVAAVRRHEATALFLVPTLIRRLLALEAGDGLLMPSLRLLLSSGSPLHAEERQAIRKKVSPAFYETYATTEGGAVTLLTPEDQVRRGDSVGRALFAVEIDVVDEKDRSVPLGETGILRYRGPGCAREFHGDPTASAEMFKDGWFYPGDLGALDGEGYLFLKGRRKEMIIRGGVNIYPNEIEEALLAHGKVAEAAVIGVPAAEMGEEIVAFVVASAPVSALELIEFCRGRLAPYKLPKRVVLLDDMPKNSSGKILKSALAAKAAD